MCETGTDHGLLGQVPTPLTTGFGDPKDAVPAFDENPRRHPSLSMKKSQNPSHKKDIRLSCQICCTDNYSRDLWAGKKSARRLSSGGLGESIQNSAAITQWSVTS
jgi:hypothetical protein